AIVENHGNLLYFKRCPESRIHTITLATNKAFTAGVMHRDTHTVATLAQPGGSLFGVNTADPRFVIIGGGLMLTLNGKVVGGVGVSGAAVEEDMHLAQKAVDKFNELMAQ
ncbi:MAG: heme-binding protein, partial [Defluviitaleaceae bacterium]|nr:heme-binding protein [Defluviitaleaceae bacterium]